MVQGVLPPFSAEAERAVLGAIMIEDCQIQCAQEILLPEDFYREAHRKIFTVMMDLASSVSVIDPVTVKEGLSRSGDLEAAGGPAYIASLLDGVPQSSHVSWYARIVKEKSDERAAIVAADALKDAILGRNGAGPGEGREGILESAAVLSRAIGNLESGAAIEALPCLDLSAEPPPASDPLVGDDEHQLIMPREAIVIASDSGVGKTKLSMELALGIASGIGLLDFPCRQQPVVFVTSDGDPDLERNLFRQWQGRDGNRETLARLPLHVTANNEFCLEDSTWYARLRKTLELAVVGERPATLIIETLASNVRVTNLNEQVAVRQFVRIRIRSLMAAFPGLTVIVTCHLRKPQQGGANDLGTRVAGSMQIRGAFDCVIALTPVGRDAFTVRRIKRSRSGGDFETFRVQISGDRKGPLSLRNEGPVDIGPEEQRGAAKAVMEFMRRIGGEQKMLKEIVASVPSFKKRAVEKACKKLSEAEKPLLVRVSDKPAAYALAPDQGDLNLEGLN